MSSELFKARALPVLEPLCQATGTLFKPVTLYTNDRLHVAIDPKDDRRFVTTVKTSDGRPPSYNATNGWQKRIPERKEHGNGWWTVAATDFTALVIHHVWPREQIVFESDHAEAKFDYLVARFLVQSAVSVARANFKVNNVVPPMPADYIEHPTLPLSDYQKVGLLTSIGQESFAGYMEQGTGKTPMTIARICLEAQRTRAGKYGKPHMMRVLIVCPRQVRLNWLNEIHRFAVVPGKSGVIRGGVLDRMKMIMDIVRPDEECAFSVAIAGYETVSTTWEGIIRVPWDLVVLDEGHYIKNKWTKRTKAVHDLRDISQRRMILTGTPITNTPMDLWAQMEFLGDGLSGFNRFENFKAFHGKFEHSGDGLARLVGLKNVPLLQERLARVAFMITKKEARLQLPEKTYDIYEVEMTKFQAEIYKKLQEQLTVEVNNVLENATEQSMRITAEHILTQLLRLSQITSGFVKFDGEVDIDGNNVKPGAVQQIRGGNPKIQAVIDMLTEEGRDPKGKTLIWALYREDIRAISDALAIHGIEHRQYHGGVSDKDREQAVQDFNKNPAVRVFIANPATAGEGLNLLGYDPTNPEGVDTYTDHEIFYSQGWSMTQRSQAEDRAHRRGTRSTVRITDLVVPGTIDQEIRERVMAKQEIAAQIQNIREILERVLSSAVFSSEEEGD